jgi:predicted Zn finger-like uncharacterized protein
MLIRCPRCQTAYKVSDAAVAEDAASFRCSRCKTVFDLPADTPGEIISPACEPGTGPKSDTEPELKLSFPAPAPLNGGSLQQSTEARTDDPEPEPEGDAAPEPRAPNPRDTSSNVLPIHTFRDQPASTKPYLGLFVLISLVFSFATAYQRVHPEASDNFLRKIPLIGSSVLHNEHLKNGVLLKSLRGTYQTIQGNREVFVVSGEARNQNPVVIRRVQIAGHLYDHDGKPIEEQVIWLGNAISTKIVRGLSVQDVVDLQRLQPLKSFDIPPGDTVPFTIVFFKPSKNVKDFSCAVQSAETAG